MRERNAPGVPGQDYWGAHGRSWVYDCQGGCAIFSPAGETLAKATVEWREEVLPHHPDLRL